MYCSNQPHTSVKNLSCINLDSFEGKKKKETSWIWNKKKCICPNKVIFSQYPHQVVFFFFVKTKPHEHETEVKDAHRIWKLQTSSDPRQLTWFAAKWIFKKEALCLQVEKAHVELHPLKCDLHWSTEARLSWALQRDHENHVLSTAPANEAKKWWPVCSLSCDKMGQLNTMCGCALHCKQKCRRCIYNYECFALILHERTTGGSRLIRMCINQNHCNFPSSRNQTSLSLSLSLSCIKLHT